MSQEVAEIPMIAKGILEDDMIHDALARSFPPKKILTMAHGSSSAAVDHFINGLEDYAPGWVSHCDVSSLMALRDSVCLKDTWLIVVSQSGMSPDLSLAAMRAKSQGAFVIAFINKPGSTLASVADIIIPIGAGEEKAVPATKSFIASIIVLIRWWLSINPNQGLLDSLHTWSLKLDHIDRQEWLSAVKLFSKNAHAYILSPYHSKAIANEMALKLKETTLIHAESFTFTQFAHGPMALLSREATLLAFLPDETTFYQALDTLKLLDQSCQGALLIACQPKCYKEISEQLTKAVCLPIPTNTCAWLDAISSMIPFYGMVEQIAQDLGLDPDQPRFLRKETATK